MVTGRAESLLLIQGILSPNLLFQPSKCQVASAGLRSRIFLSLPLPLWASSLWWERSDPLMWKSFWCPHSVNSLFESFILSLSHTSFSQDHLVGAARLSRSITRPRQLLFLLPASCRVLVFSLSPGPRPAAWFFHQLYALRSSFVSLDRTEEDGGMSFLGLEDGVMLGSGDFSSLPLSLPLCHLSEFSLHWSPSRFLLYLCNATFI